MSVEGASLRPDNDANHALYGQELPAGKILVERAVAIPDAARELIDALEAAD